MKHQKITLTTGAGATITLDGSTIKLEAEYIWIHAKTEIGAGSLEGKGTFFGKTNATLGSGDGDVLAKGKTAATLESSSGKAAVKGSTGADLTTGSGDVVIKGGPMVKVNP
jgi:hypothetical protein